MTPDTSSRKRRIFLVDDHPLVREWLANLINQQSDLMVCGEAGSAAQALELIPTVEADVAIVDIAMEGGSGVELIKDLKTAHPGVAVVVLSMHDELLYGERALRAGARGYIMKREATKNVLQAIHQVLEGKLYVSRTVALMMAERFVDGASLTTDSPVKSLSDRELEVFQLLGHGYGTRQIAEELRISFRTVQSFCARIKQKLELSSAAELLREAVRWHDDRGGK